MFLPPHFFLLLDLFCIYLIYLVWGKFCGSGFFLHLVCSRDQTQVIRLGNMYLYLLSLLTCPGSFVCLFVVVVLLFLFLPVFEIGSEDLRYSRLALNIPSSGFHFCVQPEC